MAVFIPDVFGQNGFLGGWRQANQDNWQDLQNYNTVAKGQLENAYTLATFDPAVRAAWDQGAIADMTAATSALNTDMALAKGQQVAQSQNQLVGGQIQNQLTALELQKQQLEQQIAALKQQLNGAAPVTGTAPQANQFSLPANVTGTNGQTQTTAPTAPTAGTNVAVQQGLQQQQNVGAGLRAPQ